MRAPSCSRLFSGVMVYAVVRSERRSCCSKFVELSRDVQGEAASLEVFVAGRSYYMGRVLAASLCSAFKMYRISVLLLGVLRQNSPLEPALFLTHYYSSFSPDPTSSGPSYRCWYAQLVAPSAEFATNDSERHSPGCLPVARIQRWLEHNRPDGCIVLDRAVSLETPSPTLSAFLSEQFIHRNTRTKEELHTAAVHSS